MRILSSSKQQTTTLLRSSQPAPPQRLAPNSAMPLGVVHGAFGFDRGAAFFLCLFGTDFASVAFARSRAALLAAARLSGDHGLY
jgi:hypothetical protein